MPTGPASPAPSSWSQSGGPPTFAKLHLRPSWLAAGLETGGSALPGAPLLHDDARGPFGVGGPAGLDMGGGQGGSVSRRATSGGRGRGPAPAVDALEKAKSARAAEVTASRALKEARWGCRSPAGFDFLRARLKAARARRLHLDADAVPCKSAVVGGGGASEAPGGGAVVGDGGASEAPGGGVEVVGASTVVQRGSVVASARDFFGEARLRRTEELERKARPRERPAMPAMPASSFPFRVVAPRPRSGYMGPMSRAVAHAILLSLFRRRCIFPAVAGPVDSSLFQCRWAGMCAAHRDASCRLRQFRRRRVAEACVAELRARGFRGVMRAAEACVAGWRVRVLERRRVAKAARAAGQARVKAVALSANDTASGAEVAPARIVPQAPHAVHQWAGSPPVSSHPVPAARGPGGRRVGAEMARPAAAVCLPAAREPGMVLPGGGGAASGPHGPKTGHVGPAAVVGDGRPTPDTGSAGVAAGTAGGLVAERARRPNAGGVEGLAAPLDRLGATPPTSPLSQAMMEVERLLLGDGACPASQPALVGLGVLVAAGSSEEPSGVQGGLLQSSPAPGTGRCPPGSEASPELPPEGAPPDSLEVADAAAAEGGLRVGDPGTCFLCHSALPLAEPLSNPTVAVTSGGVAHRHCLEEHVENDRAPAVFCASSLMPVLLGGIGGWVGRPEWIDLTGVAIAANNPGAAGGFNPCGPGFVLGVAVPRVSRGSAAVDDGAPRLAGVIVSFPSLAASSQQRRTRGGRRQPDRAGDQALAFIEVERFVNFHILPASDVLLRPSPDIMTTAAPQPSARVAVDSSGRFWDASARLGDIEVWLASSAVEGRASRVRPREYPPVMCEVLCFFEFACTLAQVVATREAAAAVVTMRPSTRAAQLAETLAAQAQRSGLAAAPPGPAAPLATNVRCPVASGVPGTLRAFTALRAGMPMSVEIVVASPMNLAQPNVRAASFTVSVAEDVLAASSTAATTQSSASFALFAVQGAIAEVMGLLTGMGLQPREATVLVSIRRNIAPRSGSVDFFREADVSSLRGVTTEWLTAAYSGLSGWHGLGLFVVATRQVADPFTGSSLHNLAALRRAAVAAANDARRQLGDNGALTMPAADAAAPAIAFRLLRRAEEGGTLHLTSTRPAATSLTLARLYEGLARDPCASFDANHLAAAQGRLHQLWSFLGRTRASLSESARAAALAALTVAHDGAAAFQLHVSLAGLLSVLPAARVGGDFPLAVAMGQVDHWRRSLPPNPDGTEVAPNPVDLARHLRPLMARVIEAQGSSGPYSGSAEVAVILLRMGSSPGEGAAGDDSTLELLASTFATITNQKATVRFMSHAGLQPAQSFTQRTLPPAVAAEVLRFRETWFPGPVSADVVIVVDLNRSRLCSPFRRGAAAGGRAQSMATDDGAGAPPGLPQTPDPPSTPPPAAPMEPAAPTPAQEGQEGDGDGPTPNAPSTPSPAAPLAPAPARDGQECGGGDDGSPPTAPVAGLPTAPAPPVCFICLAPGDEPLTVHPCGHGVHGDCLELVARRRPFMRFGCAVCDAALAASVAAIATAAPPRARDDARSGERVGLQCSLLICALLNSFTAAEPVGLGAFDEADTSTVVNLCTQGIVLFSHAAAPLEAWRSQRRPSGSDYGGHYGSATAQELAVEDLQRWLQANWRADQDYLMASLGLNRSGLEELVESYWPTVDALGEGIVSRASALRGRTAPADRPQTTPDGLVRTAVPQPPLPAPAEEDLNANFDNVVHAVFAGDGVAPRVDLSPPEAAQGGVAATPVVIRVDLARWNQDTGTWNEAEPREGRVGAATSPGVSGISLLRVVRRTADGATERSLPPVRQEMPASVLLPLAAEALGIVATRFSTLSIGGVDIYNSGRGRDSSVGELDFSPGPLEWTELDNFPLVAGTEHLAVVPAPRLVMALTRQLGCLYRGSSTSPFSPQLEGSNLASNSELLTLEAFADSIIAALGEDFTSIAPAWARRRLLDPSGFAWSAVCPVLAALCAFSTESARLILSRFIGWASTRAPVLVGREPMAVVSPWVEGLFVASREGAFLCGNFYEISPLETHRMRAFSWGEVDGPMEEEWACSQICWAVVASLEALASPPGLSGGATPGIGVVADLRQRFFRLVAGAGGVQNIDQRRAALARLDRAASLLRNFAPGAVMPQGTWMVHFQHLWPVVGGVPLAAAFGVVGAAIGGAIAEASLDAATGLARVLVASYNAAGPDGRLQEAGECVRRALRRVANLPTAPVPSFCYCPLPDNRSTQEPGTICSIPSCRRPAPSPSARLAQERRVAALAAMQMEAQSELQAAKLAHSVVVAQSIILLLEGSSPALWRSRAEAAVRDATAALGAATRLGRSPESADARALAAGSMIGAQAARRAIGDLAPPAPAPVAEAPRCAICQDALDGPAIMCSAGCAATFCRACIVRSCSTLPAPTCQTCIDLGSHGLLRAGGSSFYIHSLPVDLGGPVPSDGEADLRHAFSSPSGDDWDTSSESRTLRSQCPCCRGALSETQQREMYDGPEDVFDGSFPVTEVGISRLGALQSAQGGFQFPQSVCWENDCDPELRVPTRWVHVSDDAFVRPVVSGMGDGPGVYGLVGAPRLVDVRAAVDAGGALTQELRVQVRRLASAHRLAGGPDISVRWTGVKRFLSSGRPPRAWLGVRVAVAPAAAATGPTGVAVVAPLAPVPTLPPGGQTPEATAQDPVGGRAPLGGLNEAVAAARGVLDAPAEGGGGDPTPPPGTGADPLTPVPAALLQSEADWWHFLRSLSQEDLALRVPLINEKHRRNRFKIAPALAKAVHVAAARMGMSDEDAHVDGLRLVGIIPAIIFGSHSRGEVATRSKAPWRQVIRERVDRLYSGEFESLFNEAAVAARDRRPRARTDLELSEEGAKLHKVERARSLLGEGCVSKALACLRSGGTLPLGEEMVREAFKRLLITNGEPPVPSFQEVVAPDRPADAKFDFELGVSLVPGKDGSFEEVDTLEHVLSHLDVTSAAGVSGMDFRFLRYLPASLVRPFLDPFFGKGRFSPAKRLGGSADGALFHQDTHDALISVRGIAIDKDGSGFTPGQESVTNLRPICIGEALRRVAGQCQLLQSETDWGAMMGKLGQFGCGFKGGTDAVYHTVSKVLDALVKDQVPCGCAETDAANAYGSILRRKMQEGIKQHAPELLRTFDFLYGPKAGARCYFYADGSCAPAGSCLVPDGTQQGDVLGPLFFSLGLLGLMEEVRERMRHLRVDDSMIGQEVVVEHETFASRSDGGADVLIPAGTVVRLVTAPAFSALPPLDAVAPLGLLASVEWCPPSLGDLGPSLQLGVPWSAIFLRAEVLILAYLDDIHCPAELHLLRPFVNALADIGPSYGLRFTKRAKNYVYVPRPFLEQASLLWRGPEGEVVHDASPGSTPQKKLELAAGRLASPRSILATSCGIPKIMGAPLRVVCSDVLGDTDRAWLAEQVEGIVVETKLLFAHVGMSAVNDVGKVQLGARFEDKISASPALVQSVDTQLQFFLARSALSSRLVKVAQSLPSAFTHIPLQDVDCLLSAVAAGAMDSSLDKLSPALRGRLTLPTRLSGSIPGAAVPAPAAFVRAAAVAEKSILARAASMIPGTIPSALQRTLARINSRAALVDSGSLSAAEESLLADVTSIVEASAGCSGLATRLSSSRGSGNRHLPQAAPPHLAAGLAPDSPAGGAVAAAAAAVPAATPAAAPEGAAPRDPVRVGEPVPVAAGPGPAPPPGHSLSFAQLSSTALATRDLAHALWLQQFEAVHELSTPVERRIMEAACIKGAGAFLLAVPSVRPFMFEPPLFVNMARRHNGVPTVSTPWPHCCGRGNRDATMVLNEDSYRHIHGCPMAGRSVKTHDEVKMALSHLIHQCGMTTVLPKVEVPVFHQGASWNSDVAAVMSNGELVIFDVAVVVADSKTSLERHLRGDSNDVEAQLVEEEEKRRRNPVVEGLVSEVGINTKFVPFVMSSLGGFGPAARAFLAEAYKVARTENRWLMSRQPAVMSTWNTAFASTYWEMRLSTACMAMDAFCQRRIVARDRNAALQPVPMAVQPCPFPDATNFNRGPVRNGAAGEGA